MVSVIWYSHQNIWFDICSQRWGWLFKLCDCHRIVAAFTILQTSVRLLYPQTMLLYFILHRLDLADLFVYGFPNCRRAAYICPCSDANSSDANRLISMNCRWSSALFYIAQTRFSRSFCLWLSELQISCLYMPLSGWFVIADELLIYALCNRLIIYA